MSPSALNEAEHSGRMQGIRSDINPTTYKYPRERRQILDEKPLRELEDAKKRLEENDTRLLLQNKVIFELVDRIGKLEAAMGIKDNDDEEVAMGAKDKLIEENGSCSENEKLPSQFKDDDYEEAVMGAKDKLNVEDGSCSENEKLPCQFEDENDEEVILVDKLAMLQVFVLYLKRPLPIFFLILL